jgi:cell division septation protein DedD
MITAMQRDLFQSVNASAIKTPAAQKQTAFLERYRFSIRLDQAVVCVIGFFVLYAMVFSIGVEKGKAAMLRELKPELPQGIVSVDKKAGELLGVAAQETEVKPSEISETPADEQPGLRIRTEETQTEAKPEEVASEKQIGNYTIQIVTYKTKVAADKKVKELEAKGLKAFAVQSGEYLIVCVDAFDSFTKAKMTLQTLKSQGSVPNDAYIRSFPRAGV